MVKVECESCKAPYQVDERRIPAGGLKMRCPKCGHSFTVTLPGTLAAPAPAAEAKAPIEMDLPARPDETPALPATRSMAPRPAPQIRKKSVVPPALDFGDPDLPGLSSDAALPSPKKIEKKPEAAAAAPKLDFELELPSPRAAKVAPMFEAELPSVSEGANLPSPRKALDFGDPELPALADSLPAISHSGGAASSPRSFGEVDLPSVSDHGGGEAFGSAGAFDFGELELPGGGEEAPVASPQRTQSSDKVPLPDIEEASRSFDEMDLGGSGDTPPMAMEPKGEPAVSSKGGEASIGNEAQIDQGRHRAKSAERVEGEAKRKLPWRAIGVGVLLAGGLALQLTPVGAFGYIAVWDLASAGKYKEMATSGAASARSAFALDSFSGNRAAVDGLFQMHAVAPRARAVSTAAAFFEFSNQVRFGADADRAGQVKAWLAEIQKGAEVPYLDAARGAEHASQGEYADALARLDKAKEHEKGDPIASDIDALRGEIFLAQNEYKQALAAFAASSAVVPSARAQFGMARAHFALHDYAKAIECAQSAEKLAPGHTGAPLLLAAITWARDRDDASALKKIAEVVDGASRAAPREQSFGHALRGWIHTAQDRIGEARTDFEKAVKLDSRNVSALIGQGELFYLDGRLTEALPRFDEALRLNPNNAEAIVGSAKTKIGLERLNDAKIQLSAAQSALPKSMLVSLWLGKAEEALGNRKAAEERYAAATDLVDPNDKDAVLPYAALASFLASSGRADAARQKLEEAQKKLPDSVELRRSLGDVAIVEGRYEDAVNQFQEGLKKSPEDVATHFKLGVVMRKLQKLNEAAAEFDKVQSVDKDYPGLTLERGLLFEQSGDLQKALDLFKAAYDKAPNDLDLSLRVGAAYVAVGRPDDALPLVKKVLEVRPNSAEANHYMGRAHLQKGGLDGAAAMRYLTRAVELDANRPEYHLYVAWAANEANPAQLGVARAEVDKALALDKLFADAYWQRGVVERKEGAVEDALRDLKRALELKPNRIEAHAALAECYEDKNDIASALGEWAKAVQANANEPYWRFKYGRILFDRGNAKEAAEHLAFAVDMGEKVQPRPGWVIPAEFLAAEALRRSGKKAEAVPHYKLYLQLSPPTAPDRKDATAALAQLGAAADSP